MYYCFSPYFCPPHTRNVSLHIPPAEGSRLLECEEAPSDSRLQQLLTYADDVANWISAEVVSCDSVKVRGHATHQRRRGPPGGGKGSHYSLRFDSSSSDTRSQSQTLPSGAFCCFSSLMVHRQTCQTWTLSLKQLTSSLKMSVFVLLWREICAWAAYSNSLLDCPAHFGHFCVKFNLRYLSYRRGSSNAAEYLHWTLASTSISTTFISF